MQYIFCGFALIVSFVGCLLYMMSTERNRHSDGLSAMAAWLILKPIITTPIWVVAQFSPFGLIPAVGITLVIAWKYQYLLAGARARGAARLLIGLDCVRWGNSLLLALLTFGANPTNVYTNSAPGFQSPLINVSSILGLALPFIYAIVAMICVAVSKPPQVEA